jgi:hypothetical protein
MIGAVQTGKAQLFDRLRDALPAWPVQPVLALDLIASPCFCPPLAMKKSPVL